MCFVDSWPAELHLMTPISCAFFKCAFKSTMGKANSCVASNAFSMVPCSWRKVLPWIQKVTQKWCLAKISSIRRKPWRGHHSISARRNSLLGTRWWRAPRWQSLTLQQNHRAKRNQKHTAGSGSITMVTANHKHKYTQNRKISRVNHH